MKDSQSNLFIARPRGDVMNVRVKLYSVHVSQMPNENPNWHVLLDLPKLGCPVIGARHEETP